MVPSFSATLHPPALISILPFSDVRISPKALARLKDVPAAWRFLPLALQAKRVHMMARQVEEARLANEARQRELAADAQAGQQRRNLRPPDSLWSPLDAHDANDRPL